MLGVFLDLASVDQEDLDLVRLRGVLDEWRMFDATAPSDTVARIADAEVVVSNKARRGCEVLAQAPRLRLVCVAATGTNNVDLAAARARDIAVCNVRAYATSSVV
ncbi:MAG: glycerate dehydrogenase, partial [Pseudomonadota bacterium]